MAEPTIRFDDGAGYERMMGVWSRSAGDVFLDWLAAPQGLRWLDVGCGNGAFTAAVCERCAPAAVTGVDPSPGQLAYARARPETPGVTYLQGDAMALPVADASFDVATMALVLFFVPRPERGITEMVRATRPGGIVAAYLWDLPGGGFPFARVGREMRDMGFAPALPPSVEASSVDKLRELWGGAGLVDIATTVFEVRRTFPGFDDLWQTCLLASGLRERITAQPLAVQEQLKERVRARCEPDSHGRITLTARTNAVRGSVPRQAAAPTGADSSA